MMVSPKYWLCQHCNHCDWCRSYFKSQIVYLLHLQCDISFTHHENVKNIITLTNVIIIIIFICITTVKITIVKKMEMKKVFYNFIKDTFVKNYTVDQTLTLKPDCVARVKTNVNDNKRKVVYHEKDMFGL